MKGKTKKKSATQNDTDRIYLLDKIIFIIFIRTLTNYGIEFWDKSIGCNFRISNISQFFPVFCSSIFEPYLNQNLFQKLEFRSSDPVVQ